VKQFSASLFVSQIQTPSPDRVCAKTELFLAPASRAPSGLRTPLSLYIKSEMQV
jgi:hypothetical protein